MVLDTGKVGTTVSPDEAFSVLGNETRISIIRGLADADGPLSFTELRNHVGLARGRQFNYHLDKLVGHFVTKTDEGYSLAPPGERIVEAILSGVVTQDPVEEWAIREQQCYHCEAPIALAYDGHLAAVCTECQGNHSIPAPDVDGHAGLDGESDAVGLLRGFELPPAGIQERSAGELLRAGNAWANLEVIANRVDVCPRCSAPVDSSLRVCDRHDEAEKICPSCDNRYAVNHVHECSNCNYARMRQFGWMLLAETEVLDFFTDHGINPIAPESPMAMRAVLDRYAEEVVSTDPFRGRFTFAIADDAITLTVDENLTVVETTRRKSHSPDR